MKPESYFMRVAHQTPTEFWINNPTREQTDLAILHGASGCTNNPAYTQKMIDHPTECEHAESILLETIQTSENENEIITEFQRRLVKPIADKFMPLFQKSGGQKGFVSIQGDPIHEEDPDVIIREALENRKVSPNICCKIPTTQAGLAAMEYLISQDIPLNATEIFAIRQAVVLCETYERASRKYGKTPRLYISHIAGIYDDYLHDVGTTTVVATLLDLESGQPVAVRSLLNRQQPFGADVITRISATMMDPDALGALRMRVQETMSSLVSEVCAEGEVEPREVYEITVCGNVTMMHLALGIDPEPLSMAPFVVSTHAFGDDVLAREFGIQVHPRAPAFVFPSLGAYVGGDIVAGMLATGLTRDRRLRLFIDVGTNSEIALGSVDRVVATAAPAGPAFEAAQIRCGMRAAEGAIEGVKISSDELTLDVIGDVAPVGMCGSGLVDAVAELVHCGLLDHSGRFIPDEEAAVSHPGLADRLTTIGKERVFVLDWRGSEDPERAVFLSQRDVRELQFAKASIATGWSILLGQLGVDVGEITQVLLAGSFGAYLSPLSAVRIGLVPKIALPRIVSAGNVAGEGAKIAALSVRERAEAYSILREVEYVELSGRADFNDMFIDQLAFPG